MAVVRLKPRFVLPAERSILTSIGRRCAQRLPIDVNIDLSAGKTNLGFNLTTAIDAALDGIDVVEDMHASASYRRRVAAELAYRAVDDAISEIAQDLS